MSDEEDRIKAEEAKKQYDAMMVSLKKAAERARSEDRELDAVAIEQEYILKEEDE